MKFLVILMTLASLAMAGENDKQHLPKSFNVQSGKAVFADFSDATYLINYDLTQKKASVTAQINLETTESGFPIFDSYENPSEVAINGEVVSARETKTPNGETTVRVISKSLPAGKHYLVVTVPLTSLVEFTDGGVKSAFWTSDLTERKFLERYMPANLEFDQVKMTFLVNFIGGKTKQLLYTNGTVVEGTNGFKITYPNYYTASSIFFHTVPQGATSELRFSLRSIDGRNIPAVVYIPKSSFGSSLEKLKSKTTEVFHELEKDYGAYPHSSIVVLQAGMGGMEYCGATMTSFSALGHEMFHFYFARGVMPANGNAGWVDEALASWRDDGYQSISALSGTSGMSSHPYYTRITDRAAYDFGERFMSFLDNKLKSKGGLKPFMRYMVDKKMFKPFFIEEFILEISSFYGVDLMPDFKRYTFSSKNTFAPRNKSSHEHRIHRKMNIEEMKQYL
jgi:hypothetical protein